MISSYLKVALRNITRNKLLTLTNIVGLAAAMMGFIVVALYINYELSYDKFHDNVENIGVVKMKHSDKYGGGYSNILPAIFADAIGNEISGVEQATATSTGVGNANVISKNGELVQEKYYAFQNSFFEIFSFSALYGDLNEALSQPDGLIVSRKNALKYFNKENVVGEVLEIERRGKFTITAVLDDFPPNSQFQPHLVVPLQAISSSKNLTSWGMNAYFIYLKKSPLVSDKVLIEQIEELYARNVGENSLYTTEADLFPFSESYWEWSGSGASLNNRNKGLGADKKVILICGALAACLMLIALTNYINLAISRSIQRAKEVGVRKVNGAMPRQLVFQFLSESIVFSMISLIVAVVATEFLMPSISRLMGVELNINYLQSGQIFILLGYAVFCGLLAGIYPAIILSRFQPVRILRSRIAGQTKSKLVFKILLWFQFALCVFMVTSMSIMNGQIRHYLNFDLGFTKDQVVSINIPEDNEALSSLFVQRANELPEVMMGTVGPLPNGASDYNNLFYEDQSVRFVANFKTNESFIPALDIKLIEGRNFNPDLSTDFSSTIIINKSLQQKLGLDNPIGKVVQMQGTNNSKFNKTIIGVIEDIHIQGPSMVVRPLFILPSKKIALARQNLIVKLDNANVAEGIKSLEGLFDDVFKESAMTYEFLDQAYAKNYHRTNRLTTILNGVGTLIILISIFGLFSMIAFTISSRIKEIGVRKVLGVSFFKLQWTLSRQFLLIITLAIIVAVPLAYLLMDNLLNAFYNRLSLTWGYGVIVVITIYFITVVTVLGKGISTLNLNPVDILRND